MPTVLRSGPFRFFFFYAGDGGESPHVHVERDDCEAKFWLDPVRLERSRGFARRGITDIRGSSKRASSFYRRAGMKISTAETGSALANQAVVTEDAGDATRSRLRR